MCKGGCSLARSSSFEPCPLLLLSTSETPESAGLGGNEPLNGETNKTERNIYIADIS